MKSRFYVLLGCLPLWWGCWSQKPCEGAACQDASVTTPVEDGGTNAGDEGSSDGGIDGSADAGVVHPEVAAYDAFCQPLGASVCEYYQRCGAVDSVERCTSRIQMGSLCNEEVREHLAEGRILFDESKASLCQAFLSDASSQCSVFQLIALCQETFLAGAVKDGEACSFSAECENNGICSAESVAACPGVCQRPAPIGANANSEEECGGDRYIYEGKCAAPVARGASCAPVGTSVDNQRCEAGSYCNALTSLCTGYGDLGQICTSESPCDFMFECECDPRFDCNTAGVCAARPGLGESCESSYDCRADLACSSYSSETEGTCVVPASIGESCENVPCFDSQCHPLTQVCVSYDEPLNLPPGTPCEYSDQCLSDSLCDFETSVCTVSGDEGATCLFDAQCKGTLYCDVTGTCQRHRQLGEACDEYPCDPTLMCDVSGSGTPVCAEKSGLGGACTFAGDCQEGLRCDMGIASCATPGQAGTACFFSTECATGLSCVNQVCSAPGGLGEACSGECQTGLYCGFQSRVCEPKRAIGEECASSYECVTGSCSFDTSRCAEAICYPDGIE